ncbi:MAG TPA: thiolase family protein [Thermoplasmata archaeon]|nr:thiolase family protein [Thermoplasmata archaeon]
MTVRVSATGLIQFGKRPEPLDELLAAAGAGALESLGRKPVDHLFVGTMAGGSLAGLESLTARVADRLGLVESAAGYRVEAASATGAAVFHAAVAAVAAGHSDRSLVVAGERMTGLSTADVTAVLARSLATSEERAGATMPALAALIAQRYLDRFSVDPGALDAVTVQFRESASRNPYAQFRAPVTAEEVATSRPVAPPLRLLHCAAISDGAAAAVVERASGPAEVRGIGEGFDSLAVVDRSELTSFRATRVAAQRAYEMGHLTRKEIDLAEVHDAFAPFALIDLEDLGFCGPGEAPGWFTRGWTGRDGRLPVNPSGGILGRGHPVGASGLAAIISGVDQLAGTAGPLEVARRPRVVLAQSIGGMASHNFVTILGRPEAA